jgi:hypothetical protein
VTSATGALLLVDLLARAGDRRPLFGGVRTGATRSQLGHDYFVKQLLFDVGCEDLVSEIHAADFFALQVVNVHFCHGRLSS